MNAVQTLKLDARQRAMLDEMGVKVWWPMPEAAEAAPAAREAAAVAAPPPAVRERAPSVAEAPPAPAARPAAVPAPAARPTAPALLAQGAAVLVDAPRRLYAEASAEAAAEAAQGGWLVVADMPPEADGRHGEPLRAMPASCSTTCCARSNCTTARRRCT